jgi:DNA-binding LacI/PurR family transcriptional regulator
MKHTFILLTALLLDHIEGRVTAERVRSMRIAPTLVARQSTSAPNHH